VARVNGWGGYMVGKFYKSTSLAYYGWGGTEYSDKTYEILTVIDPKDVKKVEPGCSNHKEFGFDSFVCVCTESNPCDKVEAPAKTTRGVITKWESSRTGARFKHETLKFKPQSTQTHFEKEDSQIHISLDKNKKYQEILGFGGAFTDSTGINVKKMTPKLQDLIMNDYFAKDGLEYNVARIPIAGSDFSTRPYSYADVENDKTLQHFALTQEDHDYKVLFFYLQQ
jgi:glucosylceramidase